MILKDLNWLSGPDGYHNLIWKDVYVVFSFSRPENVTQLNLSDDFMSPGCAQWGQWLTVMYTETKEPDLIAALPGWKHWVLDKWLSSYEWLVMACLLLYSTSECKLLSSWYPFSIPCCLVSLPFVYALPFSHLPTPILGLRLDRASLMCIRQVISHTVLVL